jgi:hypothetical protein
VANRAKKISQNKTHEDLESSNPALTQTATAGTWQPGTAPAAAPSPSANEHP